jgi:hypothetical protein
MPHRTRRRNNLRHHAAGSVNAETRTRRQSSCDLAHNGCLSGCDHRDGTLIPATTRRGDCQSDGVTGRHADEFRGEGRCTLTETVAGIGSLEKTAKKALTPQEQDRAAVNELVRVAPARGEDLTGPDGLLTSVPAAWAGSVDH